MIKINLLSPELIKKEERNELIILAYAVIVLATIIAGADLFAKYRSFVKLQSRVSQSERELAKYESIQKQVEALQATRTALETKKNIISSLMASRLVYVHFMEDMLEIMPNNLWFRNITSNLGPDLAIAVTMDAEALDNYAIADFFTALTQNENYTNAELGSITTPQGVKVPSSAFQVKYLYARKIKQ